MLFLCSPGDEAEIDACRATGRETVICPFERTDGDYARKINHGVSITDEEWLFHAADDLTFHEGWLDHALLAAAATGASVIGTQDLGNRLVLKGAHSTHSLVSREYVERVGTVDRKGVMLHEGYRHNFVDTELVMMATYLGEWAFAEHSVVEHLHPHWNKGEMDATYELGLDGFGADRRLFMRRTRLLKRRAVGWRRRG